MAKSKGQEILQKVTSCKSHDKIWVLLFTAVLMSFYFAYLLLRIDPKLIYQSQEPVFFFDRYFFNGFFSYPGGLNELISGFFSQFFYYSWTGALLLVLVFASVTWNTKLLIGSISSNRPILYLHLVPSVFLLALHSNYRFPLVLTLGLLWTLFTVNIYIRLAPSKTILRLPLFLILQAMLYYVTAGQAFVFSLLVILYEVVHYRKTVLPLVYVLSAALLPYVGASTIFVVRIQDAYTMHLTSSDSYKLAWPSWVLYALFPLAVILAMFQRRSVRSGQENTNSFSGKFLYRRSISTRLLQGIIFLFLLGVMALYSYDKKEKAFLLIDRYARSGQWDRVLDMAQKGLPVSSLVQCQVNRALYHTGRLCDETFSMAQLFGSNGLFMHESLRGHYALQHSDLFFDLALINESEHWAYEAIAANGDTAWNLQRLVQVYLLEGQRDIAAKYLRMLQKTVWHKAWATEHQEYLSDSNDFWANPRSQYIRKMMPVSDFLVSPTEPELCLEELLNNTKNRMAFEYFMAHCLLEGEIGRFMKHLHRLNDFDYPRIPRHFEEAMLIYNQLTGGKGISLPGKSISEETIRKFNDFNSIRAKHRNSKEAAYEELKKYRNTYWFYGMYLHKPRKQ
ncbi:MAG: DUF6057 family protein [Planctomycetota bacterium]